MVEICVNKIKKKKTSWKILCKNPLPWLLLLLLMTTWSVCCAAAALWVAAGAAAAKQMALKWYDYVRSCFANKLLLLIKAMMSRKAIVWLSTCCSYLLLAINVRLTLVPTVYLSSLSPLLFVWIFLYNMLFTKKDVLLTVMPLFCCFGSHFIMFHSCFHSSLLKILLFEFESEQLNSSSEFQLTIS